MRFKVTAQVQGEAHGRQLFAPDRETAEKCVSILLNDRTVKEGTQIEMWEEKPVRVATHIKHKPE